MPRTKEKPHAKPSSGVKNDAPSAETAGPEVLTLAEAASYLRVSQEEVLRLVGPRGLPGRKIGSEWRFLKSALRAWLAVPPQPSSKEAILSFAGAWKDDPDLEELVQNIYQRRGRPMTEDGENWAD